jgi:hypothetical protein
MTQAQVKYIAQLKNVHELGLHGHADLSWWRERLADERLEPIERDGRAQVVVTALDTSWMGIPFRDLSVAVAARVSCNPDPNDGTKDKGNPKQPGLFFACAFNASRFISFFERRWFRLPYRYRADLHIDLSYDAMCRLGTASETELLAKMAPREQSKTPAQDKGFTGPLFLPNTNDASHRRWLMVRIEGLTQSFEFDADRDQFEIGSACTHPILMGLEASQFSPIEWHLRTSATHARSKTFRCRP